MTTKPTQAPMVNRVYLDLEGLALFLGGETQAVIYSCVLAMPGATIKRIQSYLTEEYKPIAYTTVATTANRLVDKGILARHNTGSKGKPEYVYTALINYDALVDAAIGNVIAALRDQFPDQMLQILENGPSGEM